MRTISTLSLAEATTPRNGEVLVDRWWIYRPSEGLLFVGGSPQCNSDQRVTDMLRAKLYPADDTLFMPLVFLGYTDR